METRSRKRAEASLTAPSSSSGPTTRSSKRARFSPGAVSSSSSSPPIISSISTRSRTSRSHNPMDLTNDLSDSRPDRRGKNQLTDKANSDKGKEKERVDRAREERDEIRVSGAEVEDDGGDGDDNDSEPGAGLLHHNLTSASSALQGLLRKLGAGLDDLLPSAASTSSSQQNSKLKKILSGLRADGEEGKQIEALTQLCDMLCICTEESLGNFSVDSFVPVLVGLLTHESNPDIMLLAARAITHLCDLLPSSCASVVHYGAITPFCARLLTIDYMDLAEQSLQALKKISQEHPSACLRAGALMAVLSYLDFFSVGVQRVALSTAANMCKKLPLDAADFVMEAVPLLTNLLQDHDAKVLEHACVCLTRITEAFASSPNKLDELCKYGLVAQAASLVSTSNFSTGQSTLSTSTYTGLIRLLSTFASNSPLGGKTLLQLGISRTLKDTLSSSALVTDVSVSPTLSRPPEQIFEIVNLVNELLPPLPEGIISLPVVSGIQSRSQLQKSTSSSEKQDDANGNTSYGLTREKLFNDQPELLKQFGLDILPVFIQIYGSSVNSFVRNKCLLVVGKLLYFSNADMIQSFLNGSNISSFLAGVLVWKDPHVLVPALQMAEILMDKLPSIFSSMFLREGVVHAVDALILSDTSCDSSSQPSSAGKDQSFVQASTSHTMRRRLRSGSTNSEINPLDHPCPVSPHVSLPPYSLEISGTNSDLRTTVSLRAKAFKDNYFPSDHQSREVGITDDLLKLESLCAKLNTGLDGQRTKAKGKAKVLEPSFSDSSAEEEEKVGIISEILAELSKEDGVSTFEFIASGVVGALLNYFSCGVFTEEKVPEDVVAKLQKQVLRRFKSFISVALPSDFVGSVVPMATLVQRLQNALSSLERFPIVLSHSTKSSVGTTRVPPGLSILSKEVKLRLCRARGEKSLLDYSSNIIAIDPLATIVDIEEFLWPRVQRTASKNSASSLNSEAGTPSSLSASSHSAPNRHSTRSKSSGDVGGTDKREQMQVKTPNSSKVKGKGFLKVVQDEIKGPQTKNATCKEVTLDNDDQSKSNEAALNSEDDDLDASLNELDDSFLIDDEDLSDDEDYGHGDVLRDFTFQVCTSDEVHDVKLNEPNGNIVPPGDSPASGSTSHARGSSSTEHRNGNSVGQRGSLPFPFAAVAEFMSSSSRRARANVPPKLTFSAAGKKLNRHLTIYQTIQEQLIHNEQDERAGGNVLLSSDGTKFLRGTYRIMYQRADGKIDKERVPHASKPSKTCSSSSVDSSSRPSLLDTVLKGELPCDYEKSCPTYNILLLLLILEELNQLASRLRIGITYDRYLWGNISTFEELSLAGPKLPNEEFINSKLTPKLTRQIQDGHALCSSSIPTWCHQLTKACPFLFPFETRRQFFYSTSFGLSRALYRLHQQQGSEGRGSTNARELRLGRLDRQKVRVSRNRILDSAARVMEMYSGQKALLEVEYFGEVGTGLGPTLEFYTLLSRALQKVELGIWRSNSCNEYLMEIDGYEHGEVNAGPDLVEAPLGLFPRPWPPNDDDSQSTRMSKVIEYFRLLGRVMAKALKDGRLLDLPLSIAFYKLVLNEELDLHDICCFDLELGKNLQGLQAIVYRKQFLESTGQPEAVSDLEFHGARIEDLCLDFTLPGYPDYVFKYGGENVSISNLEDYISLVVDATTKSGIKHQMEAFRAGFNQVFDITSLQIFSPHELDYLLCGRRELWQAETLADYIKFDHGYTAKSPAIINLLEIMGEFTTEQQRAFCQFVTGAPHLPPGGLAVLTPKLTIVRKHSSGGNNLASSGSGAPETSDYDLPSVMTCANYLKLPPYSTKEIMYKKLLYAIREGQGSFDLS